MRMRWSKLKQRIEQSISDKLAGRVSFHMTRYRRAHDDACEVWITIDGDQIASYGELTWGRDVALLKERFEAEGSSLRQAYSLAFAEAGRQGTLDPQDVLNDFQDYLNIPVEEALRHTSPLLRTLAIIDRRFGVRRLMKLDVSTEPALVQRFYHLRCEAEGLV